MVFESELYFQWKAHSNLKTHINKHSPQISENYLLKLIFNKIVCYYFEILDIVNVINLNMGYLQFTILEMK